MDDDLTSWLLPIGMVIGFLLGQAIQWCLAHVHVVIR